jgi:GR25 family glycosyltransferase involved in LPS biosynthesis
MTSLTAYVINLAHRTDRWHDVECQRSSLGVSIIRVEAVDQDLKELSDLTFAAKGVAATWLSHQKAAAEFLKTDSQFAMILEDDFLLLRKFKVPSLELLANLEADFVQLGYLRVTPWENFDVTISNIRDRVLRVINWITKSRWGSMSKLQKRLLIQERVGVPTDLVPVDIRPGGHCYVISRRMGEAMQELNNPIIFSADELFVSISKMRAFRMFRMRKSLVRQSNSVTSVSSRFKIQN